MQHSEQAASVVRLCYFPEGLRCVRVGGWEWGMGEGGARPYMQGWKHWPKVWYTGRSCKGSSDMQFLSLCLITQAACTPPHSPAPLPHASSSCLTSITVNYLSPRHWHSVVIRGEVSLDRFCKRLLRVWTGFGCDPLWVSAVSALSHSSSSGGGSCTSWFGIFQSSSSTLLFFFLTLLPSRLSVWALRSGGKFEPWRLQRGEGLVSGTREGREERRKGQREGMEWGGCVPQGQSITGTISGVTAQDWQWEAASCCLVTAEAGGQQEVRRDVQMWSRDRRQEMCCLWGEPWRKLSLALS